MRRLVMFLVLVLLVSVFSFGELTFNTGSDWAYPYHGNLFLAGGVLATPFFVYEPFAFYVPKSGEWIPRLAETWEVSGNMLKVIIRNNAKWSNGENFTADDVITAYYLTKAMWGSWSDIKAVSKIDDKTVLFEFRTEKISRAQLISTLTSYFFGALPKSLYGKFLDKAKEVAKIRDEILSYTSEGKEAPEELSKKLSKEIEVLQEGVQNFKPWEEYGKLICSGAYSPIEVRQDVMILEKNPYYFLADTTMVPKVILYKWTATDWIRMMQGEWDAGTTTTKKETLEQILRNNPYVKVATPSDMSEFAVLFNFRKDLFHDVNLRRAIVYALDRKKVREIAYPLGLDENDYAHGILKSFEKTWLDEDVLATLTNYSYNPVKAEEILKAAGYVKGNDGFWRTPNGDLIEFTIVAPADWSDFIMAAKEIAEQYNKFGFKAEVELIPNQIYGRTLGEGKYDLAIEFGATWWGAGEPWGGYNRIYGTPGGEGYIADVTELPLDKKYNTPWGSVDPRELTEQLLLSDDITTAKEIVKKLAYVTNENVFYIPLLEKTMVVTVSTQKFTGWPEPEDPLWSLCPGAVDRFYAFMLSTKLKPAK
jgi:peptide/nickel transport system substrate-binding protein